MCIVSRKVVRLTLPLLLVAILGAQPDPNTLPLGPSPLRHQIGRIAAGQIVDTRSNQVVSLEAIVGQNRDADLFVIGESHDQIACHQFQHDLIEALYTLHPRLLIGLEFFQREDKPQLKRWQAGEIDDQGLVTAVSWYQRTALNFAYSALVLRATRKPGIEVIGINVARPIIHTIAKQGFAALSPEQQSLFPTIDQFNPDHEYFIKTIFGPMAVANTDWFNPLYIAQKAWDVVMAESMRLALAQKTMRSHKGVIVAGSNHVAYQLGIPFRYRQAQRKARIVTFVPIEIPASTSKDAEEAHPMMRTLSAAPSPSALFSRGIADYVYAVPEQDEPHYPTLGLGLKEDQNTLIVSSVDKGGIADKMGIEKGDILLSIDGQGVTNKAAVNALVAGKRWGDPIDLEVRKHLELNKGPVDSPDKSQ